MSTINDLYRIINNKLHLTIGKLQLKRLLGFIQADAKNLIGLIDATEHLLLLQHALITLNHDEYHILLRPYFETAKIIKKNKEQLLVELPELDLSNISKSDYSKLEFSTYPIFKLLHYRPPQNSDCFDFLCAHLILLNHLNTTEQKKSTLADWAYDIRLITASDKTELLEELNIGLNGQYNSVHFYRTLDKLTKSVSIYREFHEELRHFMSACRDKIKHSKKSSTHVHTQKRAATVKKMGGELFNKNAFSNDSVSNLSSVNTPQIKNNKSKKTKHSIACNFIQNNFETLKNDDLTENEAHNKNKDRIEEKLKRYKDKKGIDNPFHFKSFQMPNIFFSDDDEYSNFFISTHKKCKKTGCYSNEEYERLVRFQHAAIIKHAQLTSTHRGILNHYDLSILFEKVIYPLENSNKTIDIKTSLAITIVILFGIKFSSLNNISLYKLNGLPENLRPIANIDLAQGILYKKFSYKHHSVKVTSKTQQNCEETSDWLALPIPEPMLTQLKELHDNNHGSKLYSFSNLDSIKKQIASLLLSTNKVYGTKLTVRLIENYLFNKLASNPKIKEIRASYICTTIPDYLLIHSTYIGMSNQMLSKIFLEYCKNNFPDYYQFPELTINNSSHFNRGFLGCKQVATLEAIQYRIQILKNDIDKQYSDKAKRNALTRLIVYRLMLELNLRNVENFLVYEHDFNINNSTAFTNEKDQKNEHHGRLIKFTNEISLTLKNYSKKYQLSSIEQISHSIEILPLKPEPKSINFPPKLSHTERSIWSSMDKRFFEHLDSKIKPLLPTEINNYFKEIVDGLPTNSNRKFIASLMYADGHHQATVFNALGHANLIVHPNMPPSRYSMTQHLSITKAFMTQIMKLLNFNLTDVEL